MKKSLFLTFVIALAFSVSAMAQPRAIGVNVGYGFDISYQHTLGEKNMLDLNVSLPAFCGIAAQGTYDWINPFNTKIPWDHKGKWDWEMGAGAGIGYLWSFRGLVAGAAGHVGVSYDFWFPLQLSVDWRPLIGVYTWSYGKYAGIAGDDSGSIDAEKSAPVIRYAPSAVPTAATAAKTHGAGFWAQGLGAVTIGVRYRF
ncbi:MAG: hypothetical protein ACI395_10045 [Candidatus Cryptobacteroides sp.]